MALKRLYRRITRWLFTSPLAEQNARLRKQLQARHMLPEPVGPRDIPPGVTPETVKRLPMNRMANAWPVLRDKAEAAARKLAEQKRQEKRSN